jgi:hypothetical protein
MSDQIGDPRPQHPLPIRLRNPMIDKNDGGARGYRGGGFQKARKRALYKAGYRSTNTGLPSDKVQLEVDHIIPYRIGGLTPHTNEQINLRVTDLENNKYTDYAEGFQEKKPARRLRSY